MTIEQVPKKYWKQAYISHCDPQIQYSIVNKQAKTKEGHKKCITKMMHDQNFSNAHNCFNSKPYKLQGESSHAL